VPTSGSEGQVALADGFGRLRRASWISDPPPLPSPRTVHHGGLNWPHPAHALLHCSTHPQPEARPTSCAPDAVNPDQTVDRGLADLKNAAGGRCAPPLSVFASGVKASFRTPFRAGVSGSSSTSGAATADLLALPVTVGLRQLAHFARVAVDFDRFEWRHERLSSPASASSARRTTIPTPPRNGQTSARAQTCGASRGSVRGQRAPMRR
jgi:hypothetical protein